MGGLGIMGAFATARNINPEAWNDALFPNVLRYNTVVLDDAQIAALGATFIENITTGTISARTAARGLRLAASLLSMNPGESKRLFTPYTAEGAQNAQFEIAMPSIDEFSDSPYTLRAQQIIQAAVAPQGNNAPQDDQRKRRLAYCFIAAYLMRLLTKEPNNVVTGLNTMKIRFESFYGPSRTVRDFTITLEQATAYREALNSHSMIGTTYSHMVANTHQNHLAELDAKEVGVLSYTSFLPFSYIGMHAYTMMMELKNYTKIPLDSLLTVFYSEITAPALNQNFQIINEYERTEAHPDRSILFRYSTFWGPNYFYNVRSKQCPHLLYTIAVATKQLSAGPQNSDPENIAALQVLAAEMKGRLKVAGQAIGRILKRNMLRSGTHISPAFAYALANPTPAGQEQPADSSFSG